MTAKDILHSGSHPQEVASHLQRRKQGARDDGAKIALIIEGGALRGVYSCGAAHSLAEAGLCDCFDFVVGCSSGALNALYFVSGDLEEAASIYAENATDKRCINIWNFPNVLDVDWLIKTWILDKKRFNDDVVFESNPPIEVSVTNANSGETNFFSSQGNRDSFEKSLLATSYTPMVCNKTIEIEGQMYSDGLVGAAIPIERAIEAGCTHAVVLLTRTPEYVKEDSFLRRVYGALRTRRFGSGYKDAYRQQHHAYNSARELSFRGNSKISTLVFHPLSETELVANLEVNETRVLQSWRSAVHNTSRALHSLMPDSGSKKSS